MRILVWGAAGFCGSVLVGQLLQLGYKVRAVDNFYRGNCDSLLPYCSNKDFEFQRGDASDFSSVEKYNNGVDAIIFLAGLVGAPLCQQNPTLSAMYNLEGPDNVSSSKPKDIPMFFASTGSVYGKLSEVCTEESPTNPQSVYGKDKLVAEDYVLQNENTFVYRFSTAYGTSPALRTNLLINDLVMQAYTNKSLVIFQGEFKRSFIHVRDFCWKIIWGIQNYRNFKHRLYNLGDPQGNMTKRELAELIKTKIPCSIFYEDVSEDIDQRNYSIDFSRMIEAGFYDTTTSIEQGIDELIKAAPLLNMKNRYE